MKELFHHHGHNEGAEDAASTGDHNSTHSSGSRLGGFLRRHSKASTIEHTSNSTTTTVAESSEYTALEPSTVGMKHERPDLPELAGNMENLRVDTLPVEKKPQIPAPTEPVEEVNGADGVADGGGART